MKEALGVGDIDWVSCSSTVYDAMIDDFMRDLEVGIPTLLEDGIKLLVYAGEYDLICNWLGKLHLMYLAELFNSGWSSENCQLTTICCYMVRKLKMGSGHGMVWPKRLFSCA